MSDPTYECGPYSKIGAKLCREGHMPLTEKHKKRSHTPGIEGIELPFDWCLVRGQTLRRLQKELHEAQQTAGVRLRMCANLHKELLRKESK